MSIQAFVGMRATAPVSLHLFAAICPPLHRWNTHCRIDNEARWFNWQIALHSPHVSHMSSARHPFFPHFSPLPSPTNNQQATTQSPLATTASTSRNTSRTAAVRIVAQRAVTKKVQVILTKNVRELGQQGELKSVPVGYFRNYLAPQGFASIATDSILDQIKRQQEAEERARLEEKAKAQAMATALATIGKFVIKKKVGEKDQIFGSVTAVDIVDAIKMQTGRELDRKDVSVPDIKTLGTYEATVKLHPEVIGAFKVIVQKDTSA